MISRKSPVVIKYLSDKTGEPLKFRFKNWQPTFWQIIILLTLIQLFITLFSNCFSMSQDEAMWHYIGRNWFRYSLVPYKGGVDNKSPLFYAIFGLSDSLFGINYWFTRVIGTGIQSVGIWFVYKMTRQMAGARAGILAISFYGLSEMWHGADGRYVSFTETYEITFLIISFYFLTNFQNKKNAFLGGFIAAIGLGFRLSAICSAVALFLISLRRPLNFAIIFWLGFLVGIASLATMCILAGIDLHEIFVYALADNFGAGSTTDHSFLWRMSQFFNMFFYAEIILFYPLVVFYLSLKQRVNWLLTWLFFAFLGINVIGNYARVDIKELLPALSVIAGLSIDHLINFNIISFRQAMLMIWICISPKLLEPFVNLKKIFSRDFQKAEVFCHDPYIQPDEYANKLLGYWVKANSIPNQKVFVAGYGAQVQVYSERLSPTIYFNATQTKLAKTRFFNDLNTNKPAMVLIPLFPEYKLYIDADLRRFVDQLVAKHYVLFGCMFNYKVYKLR